MASVGVVEEGVRTSCASGAATGPTPAQWAVGALACLIILAGLSVASATTLTIVHILVVGGCTFCAGSKLALAAIGRTPTEIERLPRHLLPRYTILAPIYREAAVAAQLVAALSALDYPRDRLQAILILEADDDETLGALAWIRLPPFIEVLVRPPGGPRTKPNALNAALPLAKGEFIVVYDAEDVPAPGQLQEAAARFRNDPDLACLQAPLRIGNPEGGFLARQFAIEYAGLFEAILPGLARMGAPFPLGGTSNHLRTAVLRDLGGWDPYNVTEDADLGFRLGQRRIGVMRAQTREDAPTDLDGWIPQRTRWVKGYMQTWGVHMRRPLAAGWKPFLALQATLGVAILGAALHGPLVELLIANLLFDLVGGSAAPSLIGDVSVLLVGWASAALTAAVGAQRAGLRMTLLDAVGCMAYWPLQSIAFAFATWQLVTMPHHWDKTDHAPMAGSILPLRTRPLDGPPPWSVSPAA